MSISSLVEDNWWWRPDFLGFLEDLAKKVDEETRRSPEKLKRNLELLAEEVGERDHDLGQLKKPGSTLRIEEIWMPQLLPALKKNVLSDAAGDYVLISLRGPRRVGKTTLLKLLLTELLMRSITSPGELNPLKVVYIRCDRPGMGGVEGLASLIRDFLARRAGYPGDAYVLLDEVSSLRDWQFAVKDLYDTGILTRNRVKLLITGSHSLDVRKASEVLGLRRGVMLEDGNDKLLLPMKFAEYVYYREQLAGRHTLRDLEDGLGTEEKLEAFVELTTPGGGVPRILEMAEAYINELYAYFEDYLLTGGFPLAVRQHLERGRINPNVYTEYVDLAAKDALRWRLNEDTLFNVLWELLRAPGGPFEAVPIKETSTNKLAGRLGISHNTVKQYLDYLVDAFVLLEVPKLKQLDTRSPPPKSPKKYYFWDPLMFYALKAMSAGSRDPYTTALNTHETWKPVTTEMIIASNTAHMILTLEHIQDTRLLKRKIFYHKPQPGKEIDLLIDIRGRLTPIAVYPSEKVDTNYVKKLAKTSQQLKTRGILIHTGRETQTATNHAAVPAPLFMLLA
nr:AAA family ATPase [Candidatus Sigynarchaeota archaeon]